MEKENGYIWTATILLEGPIFDFHDYGGVQGEGVAGEP